MENYVYVVTDEDREILGVCVNLEAVKEIATNEFSDTDEINMKVEETSLGYIITIKCDGLRWTYYADYLKVRECNKNNILNMEVK